MVSLAVSTADLRARGELEKPRVDAKGRTLVETSLRVFIDAVLIFEELNAVPSNFGLTIPKDGEFAMSFQRVGLCHDETCSDLIQP